MPPGSSQLSSTALRRLHRRAGPLISRVENASSGTEPQTSAVHDTTVPRAPLLAAAGLVRAPPPTRHQCGHGSQEDGAICPFCEGRQTVDRLPVSEGGQGCQSQRDSSKRIRSPSPDLPRIRLGVPSNRVTRSEQDSVLRLRASSSQPPPSSSRPVAVSASSQEVPTMYPPSAPNVSSSHGGHISEDYSPGSSQVTVDSSPGGSELLSDFDVPLSDHHDDPGHDGSSSPPLHVTDRSLDLGTLPTLDQIPPTSASFSNPPYSSQPTPTTQPRDTVSSSTSTAERILTDRVASPEHRPLNQQIPDNRSANTPLPPPPKSLPSASASQSDGGRPMQRSDNLRRTAGSTNTLHLFRQDAIVGIQPTTTTPPESP